VSKAQAAADLRCLAEALGPIEPKADKLSWARERPWRTQTHLWSEGGLPTVDLHDLGPALAKAVVATLAEQGEGLQTGAVCLITGRGRHSLGRAVLPQVVGEALQGIAQTHGWRVRQGAAGRIILITNERAAPRAATGALGPGFWVGFAAFTALATWAAPPAGIALAVVTVVWMIAARNRRGED
jgi:DNA-nicking Smr family endonuclease